jgi:hypothetical protein
MPMNGLNLLFKEVVTNTPMKQADKLVESYLAGETITLNIMPRKKGEPLYPQCAFRWEHPKK